MRWGSLKNGLKLISSYSVGSYLLLILECFKLILLCIDALNDSYINAEPWLLKDT